MKYKCLDNIGIENQFDKGSVYEGLKSVIHKGMLDLVDKTGRRRVCFPERFEEVKEPVRYYDDYYDDEPRCTCSTSSMPPCTYCESGGFCQEHQEYRVDCGCEWDEVEEY